MHHVPALARHHIPDFVEYVACFVPGVIAYKGMKLLKPKLPGWILVGGIVALTAYYLLDPILMRGAVTCLILGILIPMFAGLEAAPNLPWPIKWGLFVLLITLIPVALYHVLEKPMIDFGRNWVRSRWFTQPAMEPSEA